jgi:hypothetical protein
VACSNYKSAQSGKNIEIAPDNNPLKEKYGLFIPLSD